MSSPTPDSTTPKQSPSAPTDQATLLTVENTSTESPKIPRRARSSATLIVQKDQKDTKVDNDPSPINVEEHKKLAEHVRKKKEEKKKKTEVIQLDDEQNQDNQQLNLVVPETKPKKLKKAGWKSKKFVDPTPHVDLDVWKTVSQVEEPTPIEDKQVVQTEEPEEEITEKKKKKKKKKKEEKELEDDDFSEGFKVVDQQFNFSVREQDIIGENENLLG